MKEFLKKLTSRKFLAAIAGVVIGIALICGVDSDTITKVSGAVTAVASCITYIAAEGRIDAASVVSAAEAVQAAKEAIADGSD